MQRRHDFHQHSRIFKLLTSRPIVPDDEEIERRKREMPAPKGREVSGYLKRYAALVSGADEGAVLS